MKIEFKLPPTRGRQSAHVPVIHHAYTHRVTYLINHSTSYKRIFEHKKNHVQIQIRCILEI